MYNEMLVFENDIFNIVLNLEEVFVSDVHFGHYSSFKAGHQVVSAIQLLSVLVGKLFRRHVLNGIWSTHWWKRFQSL
jgi:F0F1-type ATP synthase alpha subunit